MELDPDERWLLNTVRSGRGPSAREVSAKIQELLSASSVEERADSTSSQCRNFKRD